MPNMPDPRNFCRARQSCLSLPPEWAFSLTTEGQARLPTLHPGFPDAHRCDFLVTWNCRHIANANKFGHIRRINGILGLGNPTLVTPLEFLNEEPTRG